MIHQFRCTQMKSKPYDEEEYPIGSNCFIGNVHLLLYQNIEHIVEHFSYSVLIFTDFKSIKAQSVSDKVELYFITLEVWDYCSSNKLFNETTVALKFLLVSFHFLTTSRHTLWLNIVLQFSVHLQCARSIPSWVSAMSSVKYGHTSVNLCTTVE